MFDDDAVSASESSYSDPTSDSSFQPQQIEAALSDPVHIEQKYDLACGVFEPNQIDMLVGAAHTGKWRFLLPQINQYLSSGFFLGKYDGRPQHQRSRFGMISTFRSPFETRDLIRDLNLTELTPQQFPIIQAGQEGLDRIADLHSQFINRPDILVIQTFQSFLPNGKINEYSDVHRFLIPLLHFCDRAKVTILGVSGSNKQKLGEGYCRASDRILGSTAWADHSGTTMVMDFVDSTPETSATSHLQRKVIIEGSHIPLTVRYLELSSGCFIPIDPPASEWGLQLAQSLAKGPELIRTADIMEMAERLHVSRATVNRWIAKMEDRAKLERVRKGVFRNRMDEN